METEQIKYLIHANLKTAYASVGALEALLSTIRCNIADECDAYDRETIESLKTALQQFDAVYTALRAIRDTEIK